MKNHRVFDFLQNFTPEDCNRFLKFLQSPYFNGSPKVYNLGKCMLQFYPDFNDKNLTEETLHASFSEGGAFNRHELTRYLSKLYSLLEKFVVTESFWSFPYMPGHLLSEYYFQAKNESAFLKSQKRYNKDLDKLPHEESARYFYSYLDKKLAYNHLIQRNAHEAAINMFRDSLDELDNYYAIEVLQAAAVRAYHRRPNTPWAEIRMLNTIKGQVQENWETAPPLVRLWYCAYRLLEEPGSLDYYQALKSELRLQIKHIPPLEGRNFTAFLNRGLKAQPDMNRLRYGAELFELYLMEVQEGWIFANNIIPHNSLNNIISVALGQGKIDWAEKFLHDSAEYLIPEYRENIFQYNLASIAFARKDFSKALSLVATIAFQDASLTLRVKRLQLKAYYELQDEEMLITNTHAFRIYVLRLPDKQHYLKPANELFLKTLKMLIRLREKGGETFADFSDFLEQNPQMVEYEWFLEKGEQLVS
ncbi:MAG: hypothetical protein AB8F95_06290 [Bacteroidia bacterium]